MARFSEHGYVATTMDAVAQDAGVAVQTVYFTFHTKAELLIAALTDRGRWPGCTRRRPGPGLDRGGHRRSDGAASARIDRRARERDFYRRVGPLLPAIQAAASVDPDVAIAWRGLVDRRRSGMRLVVDEVFVRRELRPGLEPALALDLLFGLHRAEVFVAFTVECGWTIERFKGVAVRDARSSDPPRGRS